MRFHAPTTACAFRVHKTSCVSKTAFYSGTLSRRRACRGLAARKNAAQSPRKGTPERRFAVSISLRRPSRVLGAHARGTCWALRQEMREPSVPLASFPRLALGACREARAFGPPWRLTARPSRGSLRGVPRALLRLGPLRKDLYGRCFSFHPRSLPDPGATKTKSPDA